MASVPLSVNISYVCCCEDEAKKRLAVSDTVGREKIL